MRSTPRRLVLLVLACLVAGCGPASPGGQESGSADNSAETQSDSTARAAKSEAQNSTSSSPGTSSNMAGMGKMNFPAPKDMKFKDEIESNVEIPEKVNELVFTDQDGAEIRLADLLGKKNLILVFTEGFNGMLCPFCKTQTSRLVANYEKFKQRDCEVIVVYPGPKDHLEEFIEAARTTEKEQVDKVPFPIVLDKDFAATNYFDIHSMHAHPSTYLIDKQGSVKFAYVGADMTADRPSVKALLDRLDQLQ
jgi:peroxiredoxin